MPFFLSKKIVIILSPPLLASGIDISICKVLRTSWKSCHSLWGKKSHFFLKIRFIEKFDWIGSKFDDVTYLPTRQGSTTVLERVHKFTTQTGQHLIVERIKQYPIPYPFWGQDSIHGQKKLVKGHMAICRGFWPVENKSSTMRFNSFDIV